MMYHLNSKSTFLADSEHVFSLFYEIKQEHPFIDELSLMSIINKVTGWEYPSSKKNEYKESILCMLNLKN
jgi:hypothetical protein